MSKQVKRTPVKPEKTTVKTITSYESATPAWVFDRIDRNGKFRFDTSREDFDHREIIDKMIAYASMTWGDLRVQTHDDGRSKHHYLQADRLSKEAQERLIAMHLEEYSDQIYSFSLRNTLRIIGLRDKDRFHVLWFDPLHEVCPAPKKHT